MNRLALALITAISMNTLADDGICSKLLNFTSPFAVFKSETLPFLHWAPLTTRATRVEVLKRFENHKSTLSEHPIPLLKLIFLMRLDLQKVTNFQTRVVSLQGKEHIMGFVDALEVTLPNVKRSAAVQKITNRFCAVCGFAGALSLVSHPHWALENANSTLIGVLAWLAGTVTWMNRARNKTVDIMGEFSALSEIFVQLQRQDPDGPGRQIYFRRTFGFDHIDMLYTERLGVPILDMIHWRGL